MNTNRADCDAIGLFKMAQEAEATETYCPSRDKQACMHMQLQILARQSQRESKYRICNRALKHLRLRKWQVDFSMTVGRDADQLQCT